MLFISLLSRCSFRRVGHDDAVTDAFYEAEDPEGLAHEGMPPSLDHVDPNISNAISYVVYKHACCFTNSLSCRLTLFLLPDLLSPFNLF